jgi:hypothetical protein
MTLFSFCTSSTTIFARGSNATGLTLLLRPCIHYFATQPASPSPSSTQVNSVVSSRLKVDPCEHGNRQLQGRFHFHQRCHHLCHLVLLALWSYEELGRLSVSGSPLFVSIFYFILIHLFFLIFLCSLFLFLFIPFVFQFIIQPFASLCRSISLTLIF